MLRVKEPSIRWLHLLAASGFALAQPLFDILGKNPEFFAVRGSPPGDIVVFALVVVLVPATVLFAIELLVGLASKQAALVVHYVFLGGLVAVFAAQALKRLGLDGTVVMIGGAIVLGALVSFAVARTRIAGTFMTVLAAAPVVFLCVFLFNSSVTELVFPEDVDVRLANVNSSTPVVWLLFDELPVISIMDEDGEIDAERYPNFARLAEHSTWFKNTSTYSGSTTVAVPSLLNGKIPGKRKPPVFQNFPRNLFTLLGKDYRMNVKESQTRLCPPELCVRESEAATERLSGLYTDARIVYLHLLTPPALEDRLPAIDDSWGEFGGGGGAAPGDSLSDVTVDELSTDLETFDVDRVRDFNAFVDSLKPPVEGKPTLDFLHVLLPHGPWLYFPDGRASAVAEARAPGRDDELWWDDGLANQAHQRHLLQLAYTDKLLGEFLDKLEATGLWEEALVLVTADHGISFHGGDNRRKPTPTNLAEIAFTPLFIKFPGESEGKVVTKHLTTADILPTVADGIGIEIPWSTVQGGSALSDDFQEQDTVRVVGETLPYDEALAQRDSALATQVGLFGTGPFDNAFYGLGPYADLLGTNVSELVEGGGQAGTATIDKTASIFIRDLPERSRFVPSPIEATLDGISAGSDLVLTVNGTVAAVARSYEHAGGPVLVSFLAPEDAFAPGANDVQVFEVSGDPSAPSLVGLETSLTS